MIVRQPTIHIMASVLYVLVLAFLFANVEIQIEGRGGWAANLPTWRIEHHWLLDLFLGGRAMTGYHAWVFSFVFLVFHFPMVTQLVCVNYLGRSASIILAGEAKCC